MVCLVAKVVRKVVKGEESGLETGETGAELAALLQAVVVGGLVDDQALAVIQAGVGVIHALLPIPHPLAVAPAIGAEQGHLLAAQAALQLGEEGLELALLQHLGAHSGAAQGEAVIISSVSRIELSAGHLVHSCTCGLCSVCHQVSHSLGIAGGLLIKVKIGICLIVHTLNNLRV